MTIKKSCSETKLVSCINKLTAKLNAALRDLKERRNLVKKSCDHRNTHIEYSFGGAWTSIAQVICNDCGEEIECYEV